MSLTLLSAAPEAGHGRPIGVSDWRLAVEIALPTPDAALWGDALWDDGVWSETEWADVSDRVRGIDWVRGSAVAGGRPDTGYGGFTLDNNDGTFDAWGSEYFGPGTIARVVAHSPASSRWIPQVAGYVTAWRSQFSGTRRYGFADRWVDVEFDETIGILGLIDDNALGSPVGSGETSGDRASRLLDAAGWPNGFYDEAAAAFPLQSTDMAPNRLAELHVTADSADTYFRSHRSGIAMLEEVDPDLHPDYSPPAASRWDAAVWGVSEWSEEIDWSTARAASVLYRRFEVRPDRAGDVLPDPSGRFMAQMLYDPETLEASRASDIIINDVRFARVGGAQQVAADVVSQGRYGRRTLARNDLLTQSSSDVLTIAGRVVSRRANRSLRVSAVDVVSVPGNLPSMFVVDVGDPVTFAMPDMRSVSGYVVSMSHRVVPMTDSGPDWRLTLGIEVEDGFVEAALLGGQS